MGSWDRGNGHGRETSRSRDREENPIRAINYCRKIERSDPSDPSARMEARLVVRASARLEYPLEGGGEGGYAECTRSNEARVVTFVALTNDPTTLNCNLFGTCWLGYVGIETMRLMDNTY